MSNDPDERNKGSRKVAENNIEQPEPVERRDPNEPVRVDTGGQSNKGGKSSDASQGL
ncbi:MAG TPA: hypothetical protein VIB07_05870 [Nitrososphaera sp.]|jgi:hypothetical protein